MNAASTSLVEYTEAEEEKEEEEEEEKRRRKMAPPRLIGRWMSTLASNSKLTMKHPTRKPSGTTEEGAKRQRIRIKQNDGKKKKEKKRKEKRRHIEKGRREIHRAPKRMDCEPKRNAVGVLNNIK